MPIYYQLISIKTATAPVCAQATKVRLEMTGPGTFQAVFHGTTEEVDWLEIYHTPDAAGAYPSDDFVLYTTNQHQYEPVTADPTSAQSMFSVPSQQPSAEYELHFAPPPGDNVCCFAINDNEMRPVKLKVKVVRKPSFACPS